MTVSSQRAAHVAAAPPDELALAVERTASARAIAGNTIQQSVSSSDCSKSKASPYSTYWHDNKYTSGSC